MEKEQSPFIELISWTAVVGNIIFVLWILYNGINESFKGTTIEKISYITLMGLLGLNALLLLRKTRK